MGRLSRTLVLLAISAGASCSPPTGNTGTSGGGSTTWVGIALGTDGIESGSLTLKTLTANPRIGSPGSGIALASGTIAASGTYLRTSPTADTIALDGGYDQSGNQINVSGGGYTFTGTFDGGSRLSGTFTNTVGGGYFLTEEEGATVRVFCGTYIGDDNGTWSFVVTNLEAHGIAQSTSGSAPTALNGTVDLTGHIIFYMPGGVIPFAAGDITGTVVTGDWAIPGTADSGTWRGDTSCD